jgi:apolipoprotein N-acyltransferase
MADSKTTSVPLTDPYAPQPTLWQRKPHLGWALGVFVLTVVLTYISFPPVSAGEFAFAFAVPAVLWAYRAPPFKLFALSVLGAQVVAWTLLLGWLHHVTWGGLFLLGPFIGLLIGLWYLAVWWMVPRLRGHQVIVRIIAVFGLAGLWVVLEWVRAIVFSGFPWLPLAASQWQRPFMLQVSAYAGAWAVSFVLMVFNLGVAAYAHRIFFEGATGLRKRSPEFTITLLVLIGSTFPFLADTLNQQRQKILRVALVQPYIPQGEKWDGAKADEIMHTIEKITFDANEAGSPDVIFWPEASVPWALKKDPSMDAWVGSVARHTGKPLLLGAVAVDNPGAATELWRNGAFVVDPKEGVLSPSYAKQHLVPFGEYIPLRPVFGWLEKFVPIGGDFIPGESTQPLPVKVGTGTVPVGVLICYEDLFPSLALARARAGAEVLAVLTNDAWYGEGGAATQHAAHSVLRAVETRRPVIRCGNGGWSGWIDEFGNIRDTARDENGSIFFRGHKTVKVTRDQRWVGRSSAYTENGDWFVPLCVVFSVLAYVAVLVLRPPPKRTDGETAF